MCIRDRYEAQFGRRPGLIWEKYLNQEIHEHSITNNHQIFVKMKLKREKHAKKVNEDNKITKFKRGDLVLVRTYCQSDAMQKKTDKFCELYCGPYKVKQVLGEATYILVECSDEQKIRGKFNIRQLKAYHSRKERD